MKKLFKIFFAIVVVSLITFWVWFPSEKEIKGCIITSMFQVELCPQSKNYVPLSQISKNIQNAVILTEDAGFYQHHGFDEEGIQRCLEKLEEKHRIVCGGSTITQQLAKNMFLTKDKNFFRKGVEALITVKLENTLTKKEILEKYLNVVQFGKNIFGIKQASQFYFKKSPSELEPTEAAFLAMVLPNPEKYSQSYFKKDLTRFARARINQIVQSLYKFGRLNLETYNAAQANIDYFIKGEKAPEGSEDFSDGDLDAMVSELNQENTPPPPQDNKKQDSPPDL
ncbi:MAG: monofunctional biosynthetic peptidoglycan transglycosylase, partial [Pseudobdellovibrio sp.]